MKMNENEPSLHHYGDVVPRIISILPPQAGRTCSIIAVITQIYIENISIAFKYFWPQAVLLSKV